MYWSYVSGWLTDYTCSYDITFILNGLVIMVSGLMMLAVPCLYKCDRVISQPYPHNQEVDDDDDPSELVINTESSI